VKLLDDIPRQFLERRFLPVTFGGASLRPLELPGDLARSIFRCRAGFRPRFVSTAAIINPKFLKYAGRVRIRARQVANFLLFQGLHFRLPFGGTVLRSGTSFGWLVFGPRRSVP
jgi:hypothetical protein